jgi:glycosyltransferase involved in cell wall biosynthesis
VRVLFYTPGWPLSDFSNGIVAYIDRLLPELHRRGVDTRLIAGELGPHHQGDAVACSGALSRLGVLAKVSRKVLYLVSPSMARDWNFRAELYLAGRTARQRQSIDLVEMEETFGVATALARGAGAPLVMRLHGPAFLNMTANGGAGSDDYERRVLAERKAIAAAAAITSPARDVLNQVRERYGMLLKDAAVIPNAGPVPKHEDEWSLAASDPNHILFIGRFDRHKGADIVVEAFASLLETHPDARLSFVGPDEVGLTDDRGKHWRIEAFVADRLGANRGRVKILGRVPNHELPTLRRSARIVVHPSRYEVLGIALLEACSQGVPVVAADVGGHAEIVQHGRTGMLFPAADRAALADCFRTLLDNPELAAKTGAALLEDYRRRFLPATIAQLTHEFYANVLARNRHR